MCLKFTREQNVTIWINVANGTGKHGSFLVSFANTFILADPFNQLILHGASETLIEKYNLNKPEYLKES